MAKKGGLASFFQNAFGTTVPNQSKPGDVVDHNVCEYFSEPRVAEHHGDPEIFFTGVGGKNYHGRVDDVAKNVLSTTMTFDQNPVPKK